MTTGNFNNTENSKKAGDENRSAYIFAILAAQVMAIAAICMILFGREESYARAQSEINSMWGNSQIISSVYTYDFKKGVYQSPKNIKMRAELLPEIRYRGIYKTVLYTANVSVNADFKKIEGDTPSIFFKVADASGVVSVSAKIDGRDANFSFNEDKYAFELPIPAEAARNGLKLDLSVVLRGSESFKYAPLDAAGEYEIRSKWDSPKFVGAMLPDKRTISDGSFSAQWRLGSLFKITPKVPEKFDAASTRTFGVDVIVPLMPYAKLWRLNTYSYFFVAIFMAVLLLAERAAKTKLHNCQLAVAATVFPLFYLLTLSSSEYIGFTASFAICAAVTTLMVSVYAFAAFGNRRAAAVVLFSNIAAYSVIYTLTAVSASLLLGSIFVAVLVILAMCCTAKMKK